MKLSLLSYTILLFASWLLLHEWERLPADDVVITAMDVGQGDALLITTPGRQRILIDSGPDLALLERLGEEMPFLDRRIDLLILSHPDLDHIAALPSVLQRYDVRRVMMNGTDKSSSIYQAFLTAIHESEAEVIIADAAHDLDLGDGVFLDVLWPLASLFGQQVDNANNYSIVAKLIWNDRSILLTGDIEGEIEQRLLAEGIDVRADILKAPHHGSDSSSTTPFLRAVDPAVAIISAGRQNAFGHPHQSVLDRYDALHIPVRRTDVEGRVRIALNSVL